MATPGQAPERIAPADAPGRCAEVLLDAAGRIVDPLLLVELDRSAVVAAAAVRRADPTVVGLVDELAAA